MEQSSDTNKKPHISSGLLIAIVVAVAAIVIAVILGVALVLANREEPVSVSSGPVSIGYAAEAKVLLDQNELQAAMDEAMENAKNGNIGLKYKNNAYSSDGLNFECYIANSSANKFDMFLTIFTDAAMTDQIFISELVPPGSGFENITLDRELGLGDHTVYVVLTQVETEEDEQVIKRQVAHTMEFHVGKY